MIKQLKGFKVNILPPRALQDGPVHDADQDQGENDHTPEQASIQPMIYLNN